MEASDYSAADPLEVTFISGSAMQDSTSCAQITILDDNAFEGPHSFTFEVSTVEIESDGTDPLLTIGTMSSATVNIVDNDGNIYMTSFECSRSRRSYCIILCVDIVPIGV